MTKKDKVFIRQRASACCEYCLSQDQYSSSSFSIEHIIPLAKTGTNNLGNLAYSCQGCNNYKGIATDAIDPATGLIVHLYNPEQKVGQIIFNGLMIYAISPELRQSGGQRFNGCDLIEIMW